MGPATETPRDDAVTSARSPYLFFTDAESLRTIDVLRVLYALTAVVAFLLTEVGRNVYRPYIYEHGINDFGIADSMGNLGGIVVQVFFSLAILNSQKGKAFNVIGFLVAGYILYEIVQRYLPNGVFDWIDIYGTVVGGMVATMFLLLLRLTVRRNRVLVRL
jgi:hypothetical protein